MPYRGALNGLFLVYCLSWNKRNTHIYNIFNLIAFYGILIIVVTLCLINTAANYSHVN
jgi:hypothetical protein